MTRWFRLYDDVINDPKLLKLPEALRWAWVALLCVASKNGGRLPPADDVALLLRMPEAKAAEVITKLVKAKLIDNADGVFVPHNWEGRQYKSDVTDPTNSQRQKRYRENRRNGRNGVTGNGSNGVTDKRPEADTEADSEQSRADALPAVDEDLKRRAAALGAGISSHFIARNQPIPDLRRCEHWLSEGYAAGTVLTAVETVLKRGKTISTLEYFDGAIRDQHAKAPAPSVPQVVSSQDFIVEGTLEWNCWEQHLRETTRKGSPVTDRTGDDGRTCRGWYRPTKFPPGYDEATGEKLAPSKEDAA